MTDSKKGSFASFRSHYELFFPHQTKPRWEVSLSSHDLLRNSRIELRTSSLWVDFNVKSFVVTSLVEFHLAFFSVSRSVCLVSSLACHWPKTGRIYGGGRTRRTPSRRQKINKIKKISIWTLPLCLLMRRPLGIPNLCPLLL